eukprot:5173600-Prymnesium_polylepis.1
MSLKQCHATSGFTRQAVSRGKRFHKASERQTATAHLANSVLLHLLGQQALNVKGLGVLPPVTVELLPALALLAYYNAALSPAHLAHHAIAVATRVVAVEVVRLSTVGFMEERLELRAVGDAVLLRQCKGQRGCTLQLETLQLVLEANAGG